MFNYTRQISRFRANGWSEVIIENKRALLTCNHGHSTTRTMYKVEPCVECKVQQKFKLNIIEMEQLACNYGLTILEFKQKTPRNTSTVKVKCGRGHIRSYVFSAFRYLETPCIACEREDAKKINTR